MTDTRTVEFHVVTPAGTIRLMPSPTNVGDDHHLFLTREQAEAYLKRSRK